jgi:type IV secretory pathway VirB2 component (pilin)
MIKKLFSKTFYALFFTTSLMIGGFDALGADQVKTITNTAATCSAECAATPLAAFTCSSSTREDIITIKGPGSLSASYQPCSTRADAYPVVAADLSAYCVDQCTKIRAKLKGDVADEAYNISQNTFTKSMCNALRIVTGSAGKTFAAFAIIATGIGFFTGKVSWGLMIGVTAGIATMFGAPSIVAAISGQDLKTSCNVN